VGSSPTSGASCSGYANPERRRAGRRDHFPLGKVAFPARFHCETARYAMLWLIAVNVDKRHFIVQQQTLSNRQNLMTQDGGASERQPLNCRRAWGSRSLLPARTLRMRTDV